MPKFTAKGDVGPAPKHRLCVHLLKCFGAIFDLAMRHHLEPLGLCDRVGASVRLKVGNDEVKSPLCGRAAIGELLESLSDARRITQKDLQATPWSVDRSRHSGASEERIGRRG